MSEPGSTPPRGGGRAALEAELARYPARSVTVRLCDALLRALPGAPALPPYTSVAGAGAAMVPPVPAEVVERAERLADEIGVERALFAARSIDTGDTGISIFTGVSSALSLFFGSGKSKAAEGSAGSAGSQQRADAALKALGLAYLVTQLVPRPPSQRLAVLQSIPAGQEIVLYYAAVELALPFCDQVQEAGGSFVADLVEQQSRSVGAKLLGVIGRQGVDDAQETLSHLVRLLDEAALLVVPHTISMAESLRSVLPKAIGGGLALQDVVATGADALPSYRYLCARLAAESCLALAKLELMPEVELPSMTLETEAPAPAPPPPSLPADLLSAAAAASGLRPRAPGAAVGAEEGAGAQPAPSSPGEAPADPFAAPSQAAPANPFAPVDEAPADPFAAPSQAAPANPFAAPSQAAPANPFAPVDEAPADPFAAPSQAAPANPFAPVDEAPADPFAAPSQAAPANPFAPVDEAPAQPEPPVTEPPVTEQPAAPAERATPPRDEAPPERLPPDQRITGTFLRVDGGRELWLVFTADGRFTTHPPRNPPPVDWEAHAAAGHPVARYRRDDRQVHLTWPGGDTTVSTFALDTYELELDGLPASRCDFALTGRTLAGRWRRRGSEDWLELRADGTWSAAGETGRYRLGTASIALTPEGGEPRVLSLLSTLRPRASTPETLWIGGESYELEPSST